MRRFLLLGGHPFAPGFGLALMWELGRGGRPFVHIGATEPKGAAERVEGCRPLQEDDDDDDDGATELEGPVERAGGRRLLLEDDDGDVGVCAAWQRDPLAG